MVTRQTKRGVGRGVTAASAGIAVMALSAASFGSSSTVHDAVRLRAPQAVATSPGLEPRRAATASTVHTSATSRPDSVETTTTVPTTIGPTTTTEPAPLTAAALPAAPSPSGDPSGLPPLTSGDTGELVIVLQTRLNELGFRTADEPGYFGAGTWSAVMALQKFEGLERTGSVDSLTWTHLYAPTGVMPPPRPATGIQLEVDLERQVVIVLNAEQPLQVTILNTSTGGNYAYTSPDGHEDIAFTPTGMYNGYRRYDGVEEAPLGTLYRPIYFYQGWAVHGSPDVPAYPASHGCVRLSFEDMDWLWDRAPDDLPVTIRESMGTPIAAPEAAQSAVGA